MSRNDENSQRRDRVRVALCGRTEGGQRWSEPLVVRTKKFAFKMEPWPAARPDDLKNPGYDVTRFNLVHWRKAIYALYLSMGGSAEVKLEPGAYNARWFNPRNGAFTKLPDVAGPAWSSPLAPDSNDWALLLERKD